MLQHTETEDVNCHQRQTHESVLSGYDSQYGQNYQQSRDGHTKGKIIENDAA
jgi:hypothetical protein